MTNTAITVVGFPGLSGAHTDAAIRHLLHALYQPAHPQHPLFPKHQKPPQPPTTKGYKSSGGVFEAVADGSLPLAVVPVENTFSGTFSPVYDLMLRFQGQVHIVGEWVEQQQNALMVNVINY